MMTTILMGVDLTSPWEDDDFEFDEGALDEENQDNFCFGDDFEVVVDGFDGFDGAVDLGG